MTAQPFFELLHRDPSGARRGRLHTRHGIIETPIFMPVGTAASVKTLSSADLQEIQAQIILGNTYHLYLRPGHRLIAELGGLHRFMNWQGPILTDSGGYQVFSLGTMRRIREEGVTFRSHLDGSTHLLSPELAIAIQEDLGSDIMMQLDECPPYPASRDYLSKSLQLSLRWGARSLAARRPQRQQALFAIVQGGMEADLRQESAEALIALGFDGYALGGLSVGEPKEKMAEVLSYAPALLPEQQPRYLMGVGKPEDLVEAVAAGMDMFDCVLPTRNARNGQLLTRFGPMNIKQARFRSDSAPVDAECHCPCCRHYCRAYLHHLFRNKEIAGLRLMTLHNLHYYLQLMAEMRLAIEADRFALMRSNFHQQRLSGAIE
ncbi:tRNA guanosine(34) transglycosylase Tgt [Candidatus Magnetaquicoccus inordinatus]|uniref:tRNA guanosine(34) transglycosylase Tgt n=1 Tax=Candidatus Magnetaquicoccus inordinatus TaxID=2496818 RepID=UPI00102B0452|nr:tRNA guanosine(34) transglycosylase Tgt [Candidatus Magnetaquicoccus inordinatus]